MRPGERIPLHDHRDGNSGGKIDANAGITVVTSGGSGATGGEGSASAGGGGIVVGTVTPDGTPFNVSAGTSYRSFPGSAWLDNPTATSHAVGERFLLVYRDGTSHLVAGVIKGAICTVTATSPWTFTVGAPFTIESVANDLRCEDGVSVLDVGGVLYVAVAAREFDGSVNLLPHVLLATVSGVLAGSPTFARYNVGLSGHTQDFTQGRVHKLASGLYGLAAGYIAGTTDAIVWLTTPDPTDWSTPTIGTIASSTVAGRECNVEQLPDGSLRAALRNDTSSIQEYATSTDDGASWSGLATAFAPATGYPSWRPLTSTIWLDVYRSTASGSPTAWRQTATGDPGWTGETILDGSGGAMEYATILQLDDNHVLVIYGYETSSSDCDLYSQVFTDSTVFATSGKVRVSESDTTPGFLGDKVVAGPGITVTREHSSGVEDLAIAATFGGTAAEVSIADAGGYYDSLEVEDSLQEVGARLASVAAATLLTVDPGTITYDTSGADVVVGIATNWGYDSSGPYYNSDGAAAGQEAILAMDPTDGELVAVPYNP